MNKAILKFIVFLIAALHINQSAFAELFVVDEVTQGIVDINTSKHKTSVVSIALSQVETAKQDTKQQPIIKPLPRWTLSAGHAIGQELKTWGSKAGWNVIWNLPRDVIVPSTTEFVGEFKTVARSVIETLAANGALINAKFYEGNKTMVINGPGVTPQN